MNPLIAALLQYGIPALLQGGATLGAGAMASSATNSANAANIDFAKKANAVQNQQWATEMKMKRDELSNEDQKAFVDWINQVPARQKNFINMWGGR
jgi:hypothetical protein